MATQIHSKQQFLVNSNIPMNNFKITNAADATNAQDYVTLQQLQSVQQGLDVKDSVRAATTGNITLTGVQTVDGVALAVDDRVGVKNQTTPSQNGIYIVSAGAWTRSSDADTNAEVTSGMFFFTEEGTVNDNTGWLLTTNNPIVLNTTPLTFVQFSGAGSYTAGSGLSLTGSQFSVNVDNVTTGVIGNNVVVKSSAIQFQVLMSSGSTSTAAQWGAINISSLNSTTGILPISRGGTNSGAALNNNRIMVSSGGAIVEGAAMTNGQLLIGNTGNLPSVSTLSAGSNINIVNGAGTITISATGFLATSNFVDFAIPSGTKNGVNANFTLPDVPTVNSVKLFTNGLQQIEGTDYNMSGATITYITGSIPDASDAIWAHYRK